MAFYSIDNDSIEISACSHNCVCKDLFGHQKEFTIQFAGFSKFHNRGIQFRDNFYVERLAESWNEKIHDYQVTVYRDEVVKEGMVLRMLVEIIHPHLMQIKRFCDCTVVLEYIPGLLLNAKKEKWLLGPRSGEEDYADICTKSEMVSVFQQIGSALLELHKCGICHTDPIDHNVLVTPNKTAKLIDLVGAMPMNSQLLKLDRYIFLNRLVLPMSMKKGISLPVSIQSKIDAEGNYEISDLLMELNDITG